MTYSIYHIEGDKIGLTDNMKERMRAQGYTEWEILEEHTCIFTASERELELQRQYGYKVDTVPYWKVVKSNQCPIARAKTSASLKGIKRNFTREHQQKASRAGHLVKLEKGTYDDIGRQKRKLTFEDAEAIRVLCNNGMRHRDAAKEYGVSQRTIGCIVNFKIYKKP